MMQINLTGFLNGKNAREFMGELWPLLLSAQENIAGIPSAFLELKKEEIKQRQVSPFFFFCNVDLRESSIQIAETALDFT